MRKRFDRKAPVVKFNCFFNNIITKSMRRRPGWTDAKDQDERSIDIFWVDTLWMHERFDTIYFEEHMRVNHFPRFYELTRKNLLAKNLKRFIKMKKSSKSQDVELRDQIDQIMSFFPTTYDLPDQWHMFVEEFKKERNHNRADKPIWIMKPVSKSQGRGIFLFRDLKDIQDWKRDGKEKKENAEEAETYIVQRYIEQPLLIGGKKFDMRIYVLVTSYVPLRAWVYREGFVRFSGTRYSLDQIEDTFVHLTNVAIQKTAPDYNPDRGAKWPLMNLRRYMETSRGIQVSNAAFRRINEMFWYSLLAVQDKVINDKHCFELYGYDVLFDESLNVWLIEVNASPSFAHSSEDDKSLKLRVLDDTFNVVDMEKKLTGAETRIGGFDLLTESLDCYLGCDNSDREIQLRRVYREARKEREIIEQE